MTAMKYDHLRFQWDHPNQGQTFPRSISESGLPKHADYYCPIERYRAPGRYAWLTVVVAATLCAVGIAAWGAA